MSQRKIAKTVFIKIWTPNMRYLAMVLNRADRTPRGDPQPMSWGLVGGGQIEDDYEEKMLNLARSVCGQPDRDEEYLAEMATAIREAREEAGVRYNEITIDPAALAIEKSNDHHVIVCNGHYYCNFLEKLCPSDPKGQVIEARWVPVEDLQDRRIDGVRIYSSHLDIINDVRDPRYAYSSR